MMNLPARRTRSVFVIPAALAAAAAAAVSWSCAKVETENKVDVKPIEVKPIHITVDVNVRVDHELDNFFAFENEPTTKPAATQPATAPAATTVQSASTGA